MARLPDLEKFAEEHNLKIAKIADLIAYRSREEKLVKRLVEGSITSQFGGKFKTIVYVNTVAYAEHIALIKGDISADTPTLVRMHALDVLDDVLGEKPSMLHTSMQKIADAGTGVIVLLREPRRANLSDTLRRRNAEPVAATNHLRTYGIGAQILKDLGVKDMTLLSNNPRPIVGLDAYGLNIVGYEPIQLNEAAA
jgi:3,4-dihydroxy 2-butanone 4-phosphate synthase/GTP cyclohydrolase II